LTSPIRSPSIRESLFTALAVFLGLFWGYGFQETGTAGTASLQLEAANATSTFPVWVSQTQTSLVLVLRATGAQAVLFVALLLIPRIPTKPVRYKHIPELFPLATIFAWFALILSAMASAIPQAFLSIRSVCGPSTPEINFALGQIFTFLAFSRAYVDVANVLAIFTGIWLTAAINTGPLHNRRLLIRFPTAVFLPLILLTQFFYATPLLVATIDPCVSVGGTGAIGQLPTWWGYVAGPILLAFMLLGLLVLRKPKKGVGSLGP